MVSFHGGVDRSVEQEIRGPQTRGPGTAAGVQRRDARDAGDRRERQSSERTAKQKNQLE